MDEAISTGVICGDDDSAPLVDRARQVAAFAALRADAEDADGAFPREAVDELGRCGLLLAPFPTEMGGRQHCRIKALTANDLVAVDRYEINSMLVIVLIDFEPVGAL